MMTWLRVFFDRRHWRMPVEVERRQTPRVRMKEADQRLQASIQRLQGVLRNGTDKHI